MIHLARPYLGSPWLGSEKKLMKSPEAHEPEGVQPRRDELVADPTSVITAPLGHLDFATVIRVSQAVSGEMVLGKLLDTLMRTAVEHTGAQRALLILSRDAKREVAAEATASSG